MRCAVLLLVVGCGSATPPLQDAPAGSDGGSPDGLVCVEDQACTGNPDPCHTGTTACTPAETCVDGAAVPDGTACGTATCTLGTCLDPVTITGDVDLSKAHVTPGRVCAEAPWFNVASVGLQSATVAIAPTGDCLVVGDEVLLISLQGTPSASVNVGNWEPLIVANVAGDSIAFTTQKTKFYGEAAGSDANIGGGAMQQKVALVRVPRFGELTIAAGARVTPQRWDGGTGGVLALRAGRYTIDGTLSVADHGYRPGRWSQDMGCVNNVATETGESISGPAVRQTARHAGGSGGIGPATGIVFSNNTPISPSPGHAVAGQAGINPSGRTLGEPGAAYGIGDGTQLTMGSGSSGNLTCDPAGNPAGALVPAGVRGAGVIVLLGGDVTVTGALDATAVTAQRDVSASGGYIYIRGADVSLGAGRVTALGGVARGAGAPTAGMSNTASAGFVHVDATGTVSGSSNPPEN